MRLLLGSAAAMVAVVVAFGSAEAFENHKVAKSGEPTTIGSIATYNTATCYAGPMPAVEVVQAPKHGTVVIEKGEWKIKSNNICDGQMTTGLRIIYRSTAGYHGHDSFSVDASRETSVKGVGRAGDTFLIDVEVK